MISTFKTLPELLDYFKDESTCIEYLERLHWNGRPVCPHCRSVHVYRTSRGFKCAQNTCYKKFTVRTGTVYANSKLPLRKWFVATYLLTAHKKGISSIQLAKDIGVSQGTAWFMLHRIRENIREKIQQPLSGIVEADEAMVGGKNGNRHWDKKYKNAGGRSSEDKTPVIGILQRGGIVRTFTRGDTNKETLRRIIFDHVNPHDTIFITDAYRNYEGLPKEYVHIMVKHPDDGGFYVKDDVFHTQNIESFWNWIKRGIMGVYHQVSSKHLQRYCDEYAYKYNTRKMTDPERFELTIRNCYSRLRYIDLISQQDVRKRA